MTDRETAEEDFQHWLANMTDSLERLASEVPDGGILDYTIESLDALEQLLLD